MIRNIAKKAADIELWVLLVLSAASLFRVEFLPLVFFTAVIFLSLRLIGAGYLSLRTPTDWGMFVLFLSLVVTILITSDPGTTFLQVWRVLAGMALYYALVNWCRTKSRAHLLILGPIAVGLLLALSAPFSVDWAFDKVTFIPADLYQRFQILVKDFVHPNVLAGSLVLLLPFPLAYLLFSYREIKWSVRLFTIITLILIITILVLTRSRGAWMAALTSIFVLLVLRDRRSWLLAIIAGAGFSLLGIFFGFSRILEAAFYSRSIGDWDFRLEIWKRANLLVHDFPFSGIGMGVFQDLTRKFYAYDIYAPEHIPHAHNLFLQVAVDLGIPGIIAWSSVFLIIFAVAWQIFKAGGIGQSSLFTAAGAALLGSQLSLAVHGLFDAVTWGMVRSAPLVWIIWGIGAALLNVVATTESQAKQIPSE